MHEIENGKTSAPSHVSLELIAVNVEERTEVIVKLCQSCRLIVITS